MSAQMNIVGTPISPANGCAWSNARQVRGLEQSRKNSIGLDGDGLLGILRASF